MAVGLSHPKSLDYLRDKFIETLAEVETQAHGDVDLLIRLDNQCLHLKGDMWRISSSQVNIWL